MDARLSRGQAAEGDVMKRAPLISIFLLAALVLQPSCEDDTQRAKEETIPWPDMTSRDDVIRAVVLCYENPAKNEAMSRYEDLLHSQYYFKFHPDEITPGFGPVLDRASDLQSTQWIFDSQTWLELEIPTDGTWFEKPDLDGGSCENCYETERAYYIKAQFGRETTYYQSPPERTSVTIVVSPDESDASRWALRAMEDFGMHGRGLSSPGTASGTEESSWGLIKQLY
jgi:hypothetical protein